MSKLASILAGLSPEENAVFDKATPAVGWPEYGIDCDGRSIKRSEYGKLSDHGWQIDHIRPIALGGSDHITNLRPRHWRGNSSAGGALSGLLNGYR